MIVNLISGVDRNTNGIGYKNTIPWKNKEDMRWFKKLTINNAVIMGWTTFESLGKPLANRLNIVLSPDLDATTVYSQNENIRNARTIEGAIDIAEKEGYEIVFVIGGGSVYRQYLEKDLIDTMYIDLISINESIEYDTFFPFNAMNLEKEDNWEIQYIQQEKQNTYMAYHRKRDNIKNNTDSQYLNLINDILLNGNVKHTRSGETLSVFGKQLRFNVENNVLPLLTTKKVYAKGCIHELLWFLKGDTNIKYLIENNTHIWDDDAYRYYKELFNQMHTNDKEQTLMSKEEFLDAVLKGLKITYSKSEKNSGDTKITEVEYTYGDLGPVYGKQWTNWGGINQINNLINTLKTNPDDRRLMINAWNVGEIANMALPPCHYGSQWYTTEMDIDERMTYAEDKGFTMPITTDLQEIASFLDENNIPKYKLSVMWSQRSVDMCLGFPYDLLSYSLFLQLVAQCTNMLPFEVICCLGDAHIYKNQMDDLYFQIIRNPYKFNLPTIEINNTKTNIYDFNFEDIKIKNYKSYPAIKYKLSVGL